MAADVVIVGGGPVGLYLAILLLQDGISTRVIEQRTARTLHSRAIGIHPPALEALARAGVASEAVHAGVAIRAGMAVSGGRTVGAMSFDAVSEAFPFVLALPQFRTEQILEDRVRELDSGALVRGVQACSLHDDGRQVTVTGERGGTGGQGTVHEAAYAVAADGARSPMRDVLGVPVNRKSYPDSYLMGDYGDDGRYGQKAVLFLERDGIVESFPLPGGIRRWVVRLDNPAPAADAGQLARAVFQRTGHLPDSESNTMLSAFSVQSALAQRTVAGRTALIGDAAHEISPIGGQGMNLGWLDAQALAAVLRSALRNGSARNISNMMGQYEAGRMRAARVARRQAEINMVLGRPLAAPWLGLRNRWISAAASVPAVNRFAARRFTMQ